MTWWRPSWGHDSRGNFTHSEKTVRCSEVTSRDVGLEPFFLPNSFMRKEMHSTRWRPQDAHSSFCWASLAINVPVFVYKKPPQGTTKCEVCVSMTYRVPHRFRRLACPVIHTHTHTHTHTQRASQRLEKKEKTKALTISDFSVPGSSDQTSWVLCSELTELLSAQWQAIPLSPSFYPSVSFRPRSPPDSSLSTLWCYLLLQLAIIPSALQRRILSLLQNLLDTPTATVVTLPHVSVCLSLTPVVCESMSYCCVECQAVWQRTRRLLEGRQGTSASDFTSPQHQHDGGGVSRLFPARVCLMRGDHWFSPVTFTLQQSSGAGKGHSIQLKHNTECTGVYVCGRKKPIHGINTMNQRLCESSNKWT